MRVFFFIPHLFFGAHSGINIANVHINLLCLFWFLVRKPSCAVSQYVETAAAEPSYEVGGITESTESEISKNLPTPCRNLRNSGSCLRLCTT